MMVKISGVRFNNKAKQEVFINKGHIVKIDIENKTKGIEVTIWLTNGFTEVIEFDTIEEAYNIINKLI